MNKTEAPEEPERPPSVNSTGGKGDTMVDHERQALFQLSKPPPQLPTARPQSGGIRRPLPEASSQRVFTKQRPSTARESTRIPLRPPDFTNNHDSPKRTLGFSSIHSEHPEIDREELSGVSDAGALQEQEYIRHLKEQILQLNQLLVQFDAEKLLTPRSHTHVKNVQSIRESRITGDASASLQSQLERYCYSPDPGQLRSTKVKLQSILEEHLVLALRRFVEIRTDDDNEPATTDQAHHQNGSGSSSVPLYVTSFFQVLHRVERHRMTVLALTSEKQLLQKAVADKDQEIARLHEELYLFKDALTKAMGRRAEGLESITPRSSDFLNNLQQESDAPSTDFAHDIGLQLEQAARIITLEKEHAELEATMRHITAERDSLIKQAQQARIEADTSAKAIKTLSQRVDELLRLQETVSDERYLKAESQLRELEDALQTARERSRSIEEKADREKSELRRDRLTLEQQLRRKEDELRELATRSRNANDQTIKRLQEELGLTASKLQTSELNRRKAMSELEAVREERRRDSSVSIQRSNDIKTAALKIEELSTSLQSTESAKVAHENTVAQLTLQIDQARAEAERKADKVHHLENQLQLLETRLSHSVSVNEQELAKRQQQEESAWHQKLAEAEHAVALERQQLTTYKEQHRAAIEREREKAEHALAQVRTVTVELDAANLCLAERKKQREREQAEFTHERERLTRQIMVLTKEVDVLKAQMKQTQDQSSQGAGFQTDLLRLQKELGEAKEESVRVKREAVARERELHREIDAQREQFEDSCHKIRLEETANTEILAERVRAEQAQLQTKLTALLEERDTLLLRLQTERGTPRGSMALSEARVELQKAKQKIATLEEKLVSYEGSRSKDDTKQVQLMTRERRLQEDQKSLKKLKLELSAEKKELRRDREDVEAKRHELERTCAQLTEERRLLRQAVSILVARLSLQMKLLEIVPAELHAQANNQRLGGRRGAGNANMSEFLHSFQQQHADTGRVMQATWEMLQQELDDVDWQLIHVKNRLEELQLGDGSLAPPPVRVRPKTPSTSPFSDAVAEGKDTAPIAEQLKADASRSSLQETEDPESGAVASARRVRAEEQDTFAVALAKEMRAMKESYEGKIEELQQELRKTQQLRMESSQRLRSELDEEKRRSQQIISQLTERCANLEAQLLALQRAFSLAQDHHISLLQQYNQATSEASRGQALRALHGFISDSCREEMALRQARDDDRLRKLHDYCGSSSVAVDRDDKKRLL
ncbi:hypothetical protein Poli38472_004242 [Pythium oligandrum]|uniref:Uncharacterized protein n=1 Tax=Pythium oligandrum TaxID=41045 RepID=A0A8K1CPX0_PYTOL|nr:hypothetical protein Poli38472_004242 [Pythium oligandrum]|eukprot:TMW66477.1 hypothetical protein Poli38472_004242 [Pythium oligandrum]